MSYNLSQFDPPRCFYYRGTAVDQESIGNTFETRDFDISAFPQSASLWRRYELDLSRGLKPLIFDLGAHIGESTIWSLSQYPKAKVISVEPSRSNLELLRKNVDGLDVEIIEGAITDHPGEEVLVDPGRGSWGYMLGETSGREREPVKVRTLTFPALLQTFAKKTTTPFILKFNIEGAEKQLFAGNVMWIDQFPLIVGELHDWMLPGEAISTTFLKAIADRHRDFLYKRYYVFSFRVPD